jgi:SAGA-associated factor 29
MDGEWDVVVSYLQDIFNHNEELNFDEIKGLNKSRLQDLKKPELNSILKDVTSHKENIDKSRRVLEEMLLDINSVLSTQLKKRTEAKRKRGRSYWSSPYNVYDSISLHSEVAFKLRQKGSDDEWIQCEVTKIIGDGTK